MGASGTRACTCFAGALILFLGVGCGNDEAPAAASVDTRPAAECVAHDLDVATEPSLWRQDSYGQWFRDGCLVRVDVITDRSGPDHCGWGGTRVIAVGSPLGERFTNQADTIQFVRDPSNAYGAGLDKGFDAQTTLPAAATFSGYRSASEELWTVPGADEYVYVVRGEVVERWPAGEPPLCS